MVILILLSLSLNAYSIKYKTDKKANGNFSYMISCNNGLEKGIFVYPENPGDQYFDGKGHSFDTLYNGANYVCTKKNKVKLHIRHGALVCKTQKRIKEVLQDKDMYDLVILNGGGNICYQVREGKALLLKKYKNDTYSYYNTYYKKNITKKLIDTYYKIKTGNKIMYIRKNSTY